MGSYLLDQAVGHSVHMPHGRPVAEQNTPPRRPKGRTDVVICGLGVAALHVDQSIPLT